MPKILVRKCHLVFRLGHACEFSHDRQGFHEQQLTCGATSIPREGDFVSLPEEIVKTICDWPDAVPLDFRVTAVRHIFCAVHQNPAVIGAYEQIVEVLVVPATGYRSA